MKGALFVLAFLAAVWVGGCGGSDGTPADESMPPPSASSELSSSPEYKAAYEAAWREEASQLTGCDELDLLAKVALASSTSLLKSDSVQGAMKETARSDAMRQRMTQLGC
jgi:hypothetical protein